MDFFVLFSLNIAKDLKDCPWKSVRLLWYNDFIDLCAFFMHFLLQIGARMCYNNAVSRKCKDCNKNCYFQTMITLL